jgi:hypothetical protein
MPNAMPVLVSVLADLPGWPVVPAKRVGADMAAANGQGRQDEVSPRSEMATSEHLACADGSRGPRRPDLAGQSSTG